MTAAIYNMTVSKGETWKPVFRWATDVLITKAVTAITRAAPPVVTAAGHGMPDGWPAILTGVQGMTQICSPHYPPHAGDYHTATLVDANTVNFNKIDSSNFSPYTSGGYLVYPTPVDLSGVTAMVLRLFDNPELTGTPAVTLAIGTGITLDNVVKTITGVYDTTTLTEDVYYYELLGTIATVVEQLLTGTLSLSP